MLAGASSGPATTPRLLNTPATERDSDTLRRAPPPARSAEKAAAPARGQVWSDVLEAEGPECSEARRVVHSPGHSPASPAGPGSATPIPARVRRAAGTAGPSAARAVQLRRSTATVRTAEEAAARARARAAQEEDDAGARGVERTGGGVYAPLVVRSAELLTREEEASLVAAAQAGMAVETMAVALAAAHGSPPELAALAAATNLSEGVVLERLTRGAEAKRAMVEHNIRLVVAVARRYAGNGMPLGDLVQEGAMGLLRGLEKFEFARGHRFSTYAHWWVRQSVGRAFADQGRTVRLPIHVNDALSRVRRVTSKLVAANGSLPPPEALGAALGMPEAKLRKLLLVDRGMTSIDSELRRNGGRDGQHARASTMVEALADDAPASAEAEFDATFLAADLSAVLNTLEPRERNVLRLHFGLAAGQEGMSLVEVGAAYGITRERVRQIEDAALRKLRNPLRSLPLALHF